MTDQNRSYLSWYQQTITEIDPDINPIGAEAHMRIRFGTLDQLSREEFTAEIHDAGRIEQAEPGYLRECAESYDRLAEFTRWEKENPGRTKTEPVVPQCRQIVKEEVFYAAMRIMYGHEREILLIHSNPDVVRKFMDDQEEELHPIYLMRAVEVRDPRPSPDRPPPTRHPATGP